MLWTQIFLDMREGDLIRHGDPDYSTDSLTPQGKLEAAALADYLCSLKIDRIYSSPLGRAKETASFAEAKSGIKANYF